MNYLKDLHEDFRDWLHRRLCRHKAPPAYKELRTGGGDGYPWWSAIYECPRCGEVLRVVAGYHGDPESIREALGGEEG